MENINTSNTLLDVLTCLKKKPSLIKKDVNNLKVNILFSDCRKRFTEFYRVSIAFSSKFDFSSDIYWIRIVKNKSRDDIIKSLERQFSVLQKLYLFFSELPESKVHFSCSQPIAFLPDLCTIITKECSGQLFNTYLQKHIPFFANNTILAHCFNIGGWLKNFHHCFREPWADKNELAAKITAFNKTYRKMPRKELHYLTFCHFDYSPRNIFVASNLVEVIDFVGGKKGLPEDDIEFFSNYLLKAKFNFLYPLNFRKKMIASFKSGYGI